jgi:hypothetical protein
MNGGPLYRKGGGSMSDSDMLRQMIMDNLQKPDTQEQMMAEALAQLNAQTGRAVSDKDVNFHKQVLQGQSGRGISDKDKAMAELMSYRMG